MSWRILVIVSTSTVQNDRSLKTKEKAIPVMDMALWDLGVEQGYFLNFLLSPTSPIRPEPSPRGLHGSNSNAAFRIFD